MKDHIITAKYQKKEFRILLFCFVFVFLLNIAAVIIYKSPWLEIFTEIGYVLLITMVLYFLFLLIRMIIFFIKTLFHRS